MTTTYIKLPTTFDINTDEDRKNNKLNGNDDIQNDEDGFIYVLMDGDSVIYSFNEHSEINKTVINLFDGACRYINIPLSEFIDKLKEAGCKIIE